MAGPAQGWAGVLLLVSEPTLVVNRVCAGQWMDMWRCAGTERMDGYQEGKVRTSEDKVRRKDQCIYGTNLEILESC